MSEEKKCCELGQVARKLNVGTATIVESLAKKGYRGGRTNPNFQNKYGSRWSCSIKDSNLRT